MNLFGNCQLFREVRKMPIINQASLQWGGLNFFIWADYVLNLSFAFADLTLKRSQPLFFFCFCDTGIYRPFSFFLSNLLLFLSWLGGVSPSFRAYILFCIRGFLFL